MLIRVKEDSEKAGLKLNIQKTKIMAPGPIFAPWQIEGEKVEAMTDFLFLDSKITVDSDCSHEIRRRLESDYKPRQYVEKKRHHFANKGQYSQSYGFPVVMYRCESWTIKKSENQRIEVFEL